VQFMMRRVVATVAAGAAMALAACTDATGLGRVPSVGGDWQLHTLTSNSELGVTCEADGTVSIVQRGTNFTGQVTESSETCSGPGGIAYGSVDGAMLGGQIVGSELSYADESCDYVGTVSGTPANRVVGEMSCTVVLPSGTYVLAGTWRLSR
jgi:hypothetical protein